MALYEVTPEGLQPREIARFAALGMYERADLQRLLRDKPAALGEDLFVISEEFGQWEDAKRRIDLLAIDRTGRLVVIELKRTDDGGHMELQALRYAAMVSSMTFDEAVSAYAAHRGRLGLGQTVDARAELERCRGPDTCWVAPRRTSLRPVPWPASQAWPRLSVKPIRVLVLSPFRVSRDMRFPPSDMTKPDPGRDRAGCKCAGWRCC